MREVDADRPAAEVKEHGREQAADDDHSPSQSFRRHPPIYEREDSGDQGERGDEIECSQDCDHTRITVREELPCGRQHS